MCGIYGLVLRDGAVDSKQLIRQRDLLTHRGPDDAGVWISANRQLGFAHRRLSIVDLSMAGHQPMTSLDGRATIVFNGEIYNFREIRSELEKAGYSFHTGTDTEVLLAAWQEWGESCLAHFNGMFAFVIYDAGDEQTSPALFFARDRAGKKPLYYVFDGRKLEFASELKAISTHGHMSMSALNHYLALGYVPHDLCIVEGVKKLPPAHAARLDLKTFHMKVWRYWELPPNRSDSQVLGESLADEVGRLIEDATRLRLMADVPIGVLLSGGLDSSLVAAAAARVSSSPIQTFTVALPGSKLDESSYARLVAKHLGTRHHELPLADAGLTLLDDFSPFIDEPLADSSLLPTYMVSRLTRQHVTVALGGDGGDELFGGYGDYPASLIDASRLAGIPTPFLRLVGTLASKLPAGVRGRNRLASLSRGALQQMIWGRPYFDVALRQRILSREIAVELGVGLDAPERFLLSRFETGVDAVDRMTRTHFGSILPDDFLVKVDRASMAASLEMRSPLLDHRLVEFAFGQISSDWKVNSRQTRRVEKILARRWLPLELNVERKQGFSIPLDDWLRQVPRVWHDAWMDRLPPVFNKNECEALLAGLHNGRANGARIFALAMLGLSIANLGF